MGPSPARPRQLLPSTPLSPRARGAYSGLVERATSDPFSVVKLRFEIPHNVYMYPFSRAHPDALIVVTATQNLPGGRVLAEADVIESGPSDYTNELRGLPGVISVSRLGSVGPRTRYTAIAEEPSYLMLANELEVLMRYPRFIQNGEHTIEVAARASQLRKLVTGLRQLSDNVTVMAFGRDVMRTSPPTLTPRQHALLHQALAAGYFDVPRRITLTRLARQLRRSKSGISRSLAIVERKLAESSVAATV